MQAVKKNKLDLCVMTWKEHQDTVLLEWKKILEQDVQIQDIYKNTFI